MRRKGSTYEEEGKQIRTKGSESEERKHIGYEYVKQETMMISIRFLSSHILYRLCIDVSSLSIVYGAMGCG